MEDLIRQAFLHVEIIGPHVAEGHYDLVGPGGDIILPQVWETVVEPDWTITMHMWPMPEPPPPEEVPPEAVVDVPAAPPPDEGVPPPPPEAPSVPSGTVSDPAGGAQSALLLTTIWALLTFEQANINRSQGPRKVWLDGWLLGPQNRNQKQKLPRSPLLADSTCYCLMATSARQEQHVQSRC